MRRPYRARHHFAFSRNPYRQLMCSGIVRTILSILVLVCGIVANQSQPYLHSIYYLYWSGCCYITSAFVSILSGWSKNLRSIWAHTIMATFCCLILYPVVVTLGVAELWCDTGRRCDCIDDETCFANWNAVPLEIVTLTVESVVFIFNLLAAVISYKLWTHLIDAQLRQTTTVTMRQFKEDQVKIFSTNNCGIGTMEPLCSQDDDDTSYSRSFELPACPPASLEVPSLKRHFEERSV